MRRYRTQIVLSALTIALIAAIAALALSRLPPGTKLPTHWGADGNADRFADAATALFMPAVLAAATALPMAVLPLIEPLQDRMEASAPLYRTAWVALLGMALFVELMVAAPAFGIAVSGAAPLVAMGALLIVLGNALPKSRPGFFVGIRTPWTLTDNGNWVATHRLGGRLFVLGGAVVAILALVPLAVPIRHAGMIAVLAVIVVVPVAYSWAYWHRNSARG